MFKSIRSRLMLSFAGIALIATVALGAILLVILQRYYLDLEFNYLRGNAQAISSVAMKMMSTNAPQDEMQSQIDNLAFLTQTRIQIYSPDKQLIYDSGSPQSVDINLGAAKQLFADGNGTLPGDSLPFISIIKGSESKSVTAPAPNLSPVPVPVGPEVSSVVENPKGIIIYRSVQVAGSPFGFYLNAEAPAGGARSNLTITEAIKDPQNGDALGIIRVSDGPAYGTDILRNVAWGWSVASAVAILLAALVGWFISRRISAPVLALTDVTARMAKGDLSSRADVRSRDELGQLGRSFNEMADQVETTVATLRSFVSDAAHELRTPLTALRTNLDLALEEKDADSRVAFVKHAQAMVKRLEELNTNLLDLSRLEANDHSIRDTVFDWKVLLQQRNEFYASQAEQAGLTFEVNLPSSPIFIRGDKSQISRAMDDLVDNSCKFTPQGGIVHAALLQDKQQATFTISDSGVGIPLIDLPQIFNRFHRGMNTTSYPGSGLGLAIVKAIATAHHGNVDVQSAGEGQGSQFTIHLPVAVRPEQ